MKRPTFTPRVRVFEPIVGGLMVSIYQGKRPGELGHVGIVPTGPFAAAKPGGSAPS